MDSVFMSRPKIIYFNKVDFSKASFPVTPFGNEKFFTTQRTQFSVDITLRWIDPAMNRPCNELTLRWTDLRWIVEEIIWCGPLSCKPLEYKQSKVSLSNRPKMNQAAMNHPCDESALRLIGPAINRPTMNQPAMSLLSDESTHVDSFQSWRRRS
jgi:hypothetical protein